MSIKTAAGIGKKNKLQNLSALDRFFQITERGSTIGREIRGGLVTFFAMSYILVLNPIILSGKDSTGHFLGGGTTGPNIAAIAAGTALVAGLMSILMGAYARFPIAIAAGLGINAMLAYTVTQMPGMTWAAAMGLVVIEGLAILVLVITGVRQAIFNAVPGFLRTSISVGIGIFIAFIGLVNAGIVRAGSPLVQLGIDGSIASWPLLVFVFGLFLTFILMVRKVQGAILIGIVATTVLAIIVEAIGNFGPQAGGKEPNPQGWGLTVPALHGSPVAVPQFGTLGEVDLIAPFRTIGVLAVVIVAFSIMLADFFDTLGTMVAVGAEGNLLDEQGNPPRSREILVVDSIAAVTGGAAGVSSNTSFIESSTGVGDGARTGLASVVTGICFLLATFLSPLANMVPYEAATPALVVVGFLMMQQVREIDWQNLSKGIPAFITIAMMPFTYSITTGIGAGFITYVVLQTASKDGIKKVHPLMWVVAVMFMIYFALGPIRALLGV